MSEAIDHYKINWHNILWMLQNKNKNNWNGEIDTVWKFNQKSFKFDKCDNSFKEWKVTNSKYTHLKAVFNQMKINDWSLIKAQICEPNRTITRLF